MNWIQGQKFIEIADFTFSPKEKHRDDYDNLPNTLDINNSYWQQEHSRTPIIYTHGIYAKELFTVIKHINCQVIVITHNSDTNIDSSFALPDNVVKWYAQNVNTTNTKIESIPIGLENDRWFQKIRKKQKMLNTLTLPTHPKRNLLYVNVNVATNPEKRAFAYEMFKDAWFATVVNGKNGMNFDQYISDIYLHLFVLCPEGNGIDTHRFWETLYMKSIPVVKRNINNSFYEGLLPIAYVDNWEEITSNFLMLKIKEFEQLTFNYELLTFDYWKNKILNTL